MHNDLSSSAKAVSNAVCCMHNDLSSLTKAVSNAACRMHTDIRSFRAAASRGCGVRRGAVGRGGGSSGRAQGCCSPY